MSKDKLYVYYGSYNDGVISIHDSKPINQITKIIMHKKFLGTLISDELNKLTDSVEALSFFNVLELHSIYFRNSRLDKTKILTYILPPFMELSDTKITVHLCNHWKLTEKKKINEIVTNNRILETVYSNIKEKQLSLIFSLIKQTPQFMSEYKYPNDLSIISLPNEDGSDRHLNMNLVNRKTKKFHFYRRYQDNKIVPYLTETHLKGFEAFTEDFIKNIYEGNIEVDLNSPYNLEHVEQFKEVHKNKVE